MTRAVLASLLLLAVVAYVRFGTDHGRAAGEAADMFGLLWIEREWIETP